MSTRIGRQAAIVITAKQGGRAEITASDIEARGLRARLEELSEGADHGSSKRPAVSQHVIAGVIAVLAAIISALILYLFGIVP